MMPTVGTSTAPRQPDSDPWTGVIAPVALSGPEVPPQGMLLLP